MCGIDGALTTEHAQHVAFPGYLARKLCTVLAALALGGAGALAVPGTSQAAGSLPCDIYGAAGTACVAAYSTVRALYSSYGGPLYQVRRVSDGATADVGLLTAGGYASTTSRTSSAPTPPASSPGSMTSRPSTTT
jgi:hypothetical protein